MCDAQFKQSSGLSRHKRYAHKRKREVEPPQMAVASHDQLEYSAREEQFRSEALDYLREPVNQHLKALQRRVLTIVEQKIQAINLSAFTSSVTEDRRRTLVEMVGDEVLFNLPRICKNR